MQVVRGKLEAIRRMMLEKQGMRAGWVVCAALAILLAGCGQFFPPQTSSGGGTTTTGNYLYVGNQGTNPLSIAGFSVASGGTLSSISGSPWEPALTPTTMAVTPDDAYLYVGSAGGGVYVYTIGSNGALTLGNSGSPVATGLEPAVLRVDPTGKWLIGGDSYTGTVYVYEIGTGGTLTAISSSLITLDATLPVKSLAITPNDNYVYASLGTAGIYTLSFDSATGALAQVNGVLSPKQTNDADYGLAIAPSGNYLFAAETGIGAVRAFSIASSGVITELSGSPYKTNLGPYALLVDSTGNYLYEADRTKGEIYAFTISSAGALTAISGSPFSTGSAPVGLVEDKTDTYIAVVCSGGSPDLQVFSFAGTTPGALVSVTTSTTGTDPTVASSLAGTM